MGHRAREHALRYTPERMARGYLDLYTELLARSGTEITTPAALRAVEGSCA